MTLAPRLGSDPVPKRSRKTRGSGATSGAFVGFHGTAVSRLAGFQWTIRAPFVAGSDPMTRIP